MSQPSIIWLSQIKPEHTPMIGQKAANLGLLTSLGMPIPNGFVITSDVFLDFLEQTKLDKKIPQIIAKAKTGNVKKLQESAFVVQQLIEHATIPEPIAQVIIQNYQQLSAKDVHVAVRQSLVSPDNDTLAGAQTSYLNTLGSKQLLKAIQQTWSSLFLAKAVYYRQQKNLDHFAVGSAIIVQRMVESEVSGISFSQEPLTHDPGMVTIEAIWGLGEPIAAGQLTPDHYQVSKEDWQITQKDIVRQEWQLTKTTQHHEQGSALDKNNTRVPVSAAWQRKQKLQDRIIVDIARLATRVEEQFGQPQQVEWAYADHTLYVVETEEIASFNITDAGPRHINLAQSNAAAPNKTPLLTGVPAAPGVMVGQVKVIKAQQDIEKIKPGTVVVLDNADYQFSPGWQQVVAIISNEGGRTANAALAARDLGIPAVLGVSNGTKMLKNGETVTVDGTIGAVYDGDVKMKGTATITTANAHLRQYGSSEESPQSDSYLQVKTATKVYVNLSEPEQAEEVATKDVDGVGLLRSEYLLQTIGDHPQHFIDKGKPEVYVDAIVGGLSQVVKAFGSRPVIYRLNDLQANQYARLGHGQHYETIEDNPALGYRGAYRHVNDPQRIQLEIQAIKKVRQHHKNLWVMVPFVRTPEELIEIKHQLSHQGLHRGGTFKLFMMAEVPSNVLLLDQFIGVGLDGISIGSNDLTQLILGIDRHNPKVASQFDERNEAVMWAIHKIISGATKHGITSSISGQAPSVYPELTQRLVEWGIGSISVSPEAVASTRRLVADAEYELVRQGKIIKMKG